MSRSTKAPRRRPASGFYGVTKNKRKWKARVIIDGQQRLHCGSFGTKEEAALAYDRAAREHRPDLPTNYESIEAAEAAADRAKAEYMRQPKAPRKRPASGFYGVTKKRSNWKARVIIDGQQRLHCGSFGTKEEAGNNEFLFGSHCEAKLAERSH